MSTPRPKKNNSMRHPDYSYAGQGIYTISEASRLSGSHPNTLLRWFGRGAWDDSVGLLNPLYPEVESKTLLSFLDLVEAVVVHRLRESGFSLQHIRSARRSLIDEFAISHPFAHLDFKTDRFSIFLKLANSSGDTTLSEVLSGQHEMPTVIEGFLDDVDYGDVSLLAERWRIFPGVVINPKIGFGKPIVDGTGTTTDVLHRTYKANRDDLDLVADLFSLAPAQIRSAVDFEEKYLLEVAA